MSELKERVLRLSVAACSLLILFGVGWGFTPYQTVFSGLMLGISVGLINALYTALKVHEFSERIAAGLKPRGLGMITRFSMVALAALVAIRFPDVFHVPSLAAGLFLIPVIIWFDGLLSGSRLDHRHGKRRGKPWKPNRRL